MSIKDHQHKHHDHGAFEMSNNGWEQGSGGASQAPDPRQDHPFDQGWLSSSVHVTNSSQGQKSDGGAQHTVENIDHEPFGVGTGEHAFDPHGWENGADWWGSYHFMGHHDLLI